MVSTKLINEISRFFNDASPFVWGSVRKVCHITYFVPRLKLARKIPKFSSVWSKCFPFSSKFSLKRNTSIHYHPKYREVTSLKTAYEIFKKRYEHELLPVICGRAELFTRQIVRKESCHHIFSVFIRMLQDSSNCSFRRINMK